jgi:A/G-specific adenine glycosylase
LFPRREPKREGRLRRGAAFVSVRADQTVLLRRRPEKGLLGGMSEVPTTAWTSDFDLGRARDQAPLQARWRRLPGAVTHAFTHFPLELVVYRCEVPHRTPPAAGARWVPISELAGEALPNLMRKVLAHALERTTSPVASFASTAKRLRRSSIQKGESDADRTP